MLKVSLRDFVAAASSAVRKTAFFSFLILFFFSFPALAQTTLVTGTVKDTNGLAYAGARMTVGLVFAGTPTSSPTVTVSTLASCRANGFGSAPCQVPFSPSVGQVIILDTSGNIPGGGITLQDNALVTPAGTQWIFSVSTSGSPPPLGTGPQVCSATLTITGASQSISGSFSACPALSNVSGGSVPGAPNFSTQVNVGGAFAGVSPGSTGQVLISNGSGAAPTYQDPLISTNNMVLLNAVGATVTQTSSAIRIPLQSTSGTLAVTGAGITGAPLGCSIVLELQQSTGAPASAAIATQAFTPASTYQSFQITPLEGFGNGDNLIAVYNCATTFPTGGTITATFSPSNAAALTGHGGISNGQWVTTSDILWSQVSTPGIGNISYHNSVRILQPNGAISTTTWDVAACATGASFTWGGVGTGQAAPVNGWIQSFTTIIFTTNVPYGQAYINQYILNSLPAGGGTGSCVNTLVAANIGMILSGYPTASFYPGGYPAAGIQSPTQQGAGWNQVTNVNTSTGADWTAPTVGASGNSTAGRWCIQSVSFTLTTSATVATRTVGIILRVNPGASQENIMYVSPFNQLAGVAQVYTFSPGTSPQQATLAGTNFTFVPFNNGQLVCFNGAATGNVGSLTGNLQAGDSFTSISLTWTLYNDND